MVPEMFLVITTLENVLAKLMSLVINATSVHQDFTHFPFVKVRGMRNNRMYFVVPYYQYVPVFRMYMQPTRI